MDNNLEGLAQSVEQKYALQGSLLQYQLTCIQEASSIFPER